MKKGAALGRKLGTTENAGHSRGYSTRESLGLRVPWQIYLVASCKMKLHNFICPATVDMKKQCNLRVENEGVEAVLEETPAQVLES